MPWYMFSTREFDEKITNGQNKFWNIHYKGTFDYIEKKKKLQES